MKKLLFSLTTLILPLLLIAQTPEKDKRLKLTINNGFSITDYTKKNYFNGTFCGIDSPCYSQEFLKRKPAYFFDLNLTYPIGKRQHLGLGMSIYKMSYLIEFDFTDGGFVETDRVQNDITNKFTSYYLTHLWTLQEKKNTTLYWSNNLGVDYHKSNSSYKKTNPFYRTGLILEQRVWKKVIFTFQPFVQTGLRSYKNTGFHRTDSQIFPITIGGSIGLKFHLMEFY